MAPNVYFQVLKHHADAIQRMYKVRWVPQPHHFKMCKQLMESEVEGFEPYTPEEIIERLEVYYKETWWRTVRHDFANFCKHSDKFIPKMDDVREPQEKQELVNGKWVVIKKQWKPLEQVIHKELMIYCDRCKRNHAADYDCYSQDARSAV